MAVVGLAFIAVIRGARLPHPEPLARAPVPDADWPRDLEPRAPMGHLHGRGSDDGRHRRRRDVEPDDRPDEPRSLLERLDPVRGVHGVRDAPRHPAGDHRRPVVARREGGGALHRPARAERREGHAPARRVPRPQEPAGGHPGRDADDPSRPGAPPHRGGARRACTR